jgi:uracil-DNA glycosylase
MNGFRPLFVGEASDGPPLAGRSGRRLAALSGLPNVESLLSLVRAENVFPRRPRGSKKGDAFPKLEARRAARLIDFAGAFPVVFLGKRVASAFDVRAGYLEMVDFWGRPAFVFPHPSGVNRWWNDPANEERARAFMRDLIFLASLLKA